MTWRWAALLVASAAGSCVVPVDTRGSAAIPIEVAVAGLRELFSVATSLSCSDPDVSFRKDDVQSWTVNEKGVEIRTPLEQPFRLLWSDFRGAELVNAPFRYEVRVYMATPTNPRRNLYRFHWKELEQARRAVELFAALRSDQ